MKKILLIAIFAILGMAMQAQVIKYPFGAATITTSTADSLTYSLTPTNTVEFLVVDSTTLDANLTISVVDTYAEAGDIIYIEATAVSASAKVIIYSTSITGLNDTITAAKTQIIEAVYDGSNYIVKSSKQTN